MIKTVLVEDDHQSIECIQSIIKYNEIPIELLGIAQNIEDGRTLIEATKPELLLLDFELPDGNSLNLLPELSYKPWIIFITGHSDYIFDSFDFPTIHYLLKPLSSSKLAEAVRKYQTIAAFFEKTQKEENDKLKITNYFQKIAIPSINGIVLVELSNIVRLESENNYTSLYMADGQRILISKTLFKFEEILPEDIFVRVHKSHIVNISFIKSILKSTPVYIKLTNGIEIPVSPSKKDSLIEKLHSNVIFF